MKTQRRLMIALTSMKEFSAALIFILILLISIASSVRAQGNASPDAKLASATDLRVPAGAISLQLKRKLETGRSKRGPLGTSWRLNWESRLSRGSRLIQVDDWMGVVSFTQVGQQPEYTNAAGEKITVSADGRAVRTVPDGGSETFEANGRLIERTYHNGNKVRLRYDAQGRLSRLEGPGGSFLQFTSDSVGHVIQVESSTGATVRYAYEKDDLTEVQINGGLPLRYDYDGKGALIKVEDPRTGSLEIAYDSKGRVASYRRSDAGEQRFEYNDATNTKRVIEPDGATTVTQESGDKRRTEVTDPLGNKSAIQFDEAGRPVTVTGPTGASSRMRYDSLGRLIAAEDALGHTTRYEYAGDTFTLRAIVHADGTRQEFEYDRDNNLTAIKVGDKIVSALTYNPDGTIASAKEPGAKERRFTYYPNGLVKSVANALDEITQFEYDARGNLAREINPLGGVTVRSYDAQDRLVSLTNAAGGTTRYEYDYRGRLIQETDSAGGSTKFDYDARGRLAAETNPAGQTTRYEYSPADKLTKTIWPDQTAETYRYDLAGNLVERTDRLGRNFRFERNALGQVTRERRPSGLEVTYRYDAAGNLLAVEDSSGIRNEYQTDLLSHRTTQISPSGGKTQYQYDPLGNLLAVNDALGRVKRFVRTADGDLTQVGEATRDEARYEYDAAGRVVALHRPSGGVTRFSYDRMGNLLTTTDPLGNVKRYSYDTAGRLTTFTDALNKVTRYVYDQTGQRVGKQLPDGKRTAYKYDALGRMIEADDGAFPVRMSYDTAGNLKQVEYPAINRAVAYEYDAQGLRTKMTAPDGRETRYEYDALKRLSAVVLPSGKKITLGYDVKNRIQSVAYPNGITGRWDYDANGQVAKINYQDKSSKPVIGSSYRYDAAGNPVERQDAQGRTSRFAYDPAGQLVEETTPDGTIKYAYAAGGNRATVAEGTRVSPYKHDATDRLIQAGAEQLSYDANGNLISRKGPGGATTYEYDADNRLIKVVMPDLATTTFGYAPTGERVWRRDKSGVTYFLYDGINLIAELGNDLRTRTTYVHGLGIDRPLAMLEEKQSYYYAADRAGSITHLTDDNGKVAAFYSYDAFGKIKTKQGMVVANPFAYIGRELDSTGLYYFRARYYDATLGRFLSNDLIAAKLDEPLEQNPYLYARNNPIRFVDPLGLDQYTPEWLAGQSSETLVQLLQAEKTSAGQEQIYGALRSRGLGTPEGDSWFYDKPVRQPDGSLKPAWKPGSPPEVEGAPPPGSQPQQQVVGNPGQAGPRNLNPGDTDALNPAADAGPARPQPGPPKNDTLAVGEARNGGDTQAAPAAGAPAGGSGNGLWNQLSTVGPGFMKAAGAAGVLAAAADCYRNGLENCGPRIATGLAVGAIAARVIGRAAGPIGIIVGGAFAWWQVGKEALQQSRDSKQQQAALDASQAQAQALIANRDRFNNAVARLTAKIDDLRKAQANLNAKTAQAQQQLDTAKAQADNARLDLDDLRNKASRLDASKLCNPNPIALNSQVEALATQAETAYRAIGNQLDAARQLYLECGSAQDTATASQKAADIRSKYDSAKQLALAIPGWKTDAEQKNADLKRGLEAINDFKTKKADLDAIKAMIRFRVAKVNEANLNIETLVNGADGIKQSANKLDTDGPQVRVEIDKLVGIFSNLPPDSPVPSDMQAQLTGLYGSLAAAIQHAPVQDFLQQASALDSQVSAYTDNVDEITRKLDAGVACEAPPADAAVQRIDSALQNAQYKVNNDSDLPKLAQICEASAKCIPMINQTRQLLEQLQIEAGQAGIDQARDAGCNVAGLETALDYYRSVRDAVNLLNNAKAQCRFQDGLDFAQKIPASIQNNSYVANAMSELRAGLATQQQVEQLLSQATDAMVRAVDLARGLGGNPVSGVSGVPRDCKQSDSLAAQADAFLAQAYALAASSACLTARVDKYRGQYDQLKARKEPCLGEPSDSNSGKGKNQEPTNEVPPSLDPGKGKNQEPTNEVPPSLDPGKGRNQVPTNEVPPSLDPGKGKNQEPTNEVPPSLDPGKGKNQEPTNEVPPSLDPGTRTASNRPPGENNPPPVGQGGNELPPGLVRDKKGNYKPAKGWEWEDPNDPNNLRVKQKDPEVERQKKQERSERLGELLGGIIGEAIRQGGGGNSGGTGEPGGGRGSGGGGSDDLSGAWEGANESCRATVSLESAGTNIWAGPVNSSCDAFTGNVRITVTSPGNLAATLVGKDWYDSTERKWQRGFTWQFTGTFTKSQMVFKVGEDVFTQGAGPIILNKK